MSSSNNSNDALFMMFGAILFILAIASIIIKALKQFFIELGQSFEAFAGMMGSFTLMLWNTVQVVFLIGLIIMTVFCAIYFTIQYYHLVKDGTALRELVKTSLEDIDNQTLTRLENLQAEVRRDIQSMDVRLTEALKKPEIAPPTTEPRRRSIEDVIEVQRQEREIQQNHDSEPEDLEIDQSNEDSEVIKNQSDTKTQEITMSNPY